MGAVINAAKDLNPIAQLSDAKDRVESSVKSTVSSVEDAITPAAKTPPVPVASPENSTGPASKAPEPEVAPAWTHGDLSGAVNVNQPSDFGMDAEFMAKMQRTKDLSKKIGQLQAMTPAARAEALQGSGLSQDNINKIQQELGGSLKQQQQTEQQASEKAGETATKEEKEAGELEPVAKTLMATVHYGMFPAVAATGIAAAPAITAGVVAAELAKTFMLFKISGLAGDGAEMAVSKIFPNAGYKAKEAAQIVGGLAGWAATGTALNQVPFLRTAAEIPEVKAAMEDTQHTMSDPVGLKHVEPEVVEGPATASETAKKVGPEPETAKPQTLEEKAAAGIQKAGLPVKLVSAEARATRLLALRNAAEQPARDEGIFEGQLPKGTKEAYQIERKEGGKWTSTWTQEDGTKTTPAMYQDEQSAKDDMQDWADGQGESASLYRVNKVQIGQVVDINAPKGAALEKKPDIEQGKNNPAVSKLTSTVANTSPDEGQIKEPMKQGGDSIVQAAKDARVYALGQTAKDIGIEENEPIVNKAINRNASKPLTDDEKTDYQSAKDMSVANIAKLSAEHIKAAAADDGNRVSLIGDLFTHESAKLNHLDKALGIGGNVDVATQTAKTAVQSSDLLTTIGSQQGTPAVRLAKTAKIMDWHHYMDPANVAVSAALFNPKLWLAKAATDALWLPYNGIVKGLSHVASFHPQDAITIWGAGMKAARDAVGDATIYGAKSYATGERVAEKELGMLKAPENTSTIYGEDYETNPGQAIQGTASAFNPANTAKLKNIAGMTLNAGPRVILAEDQYAKTFAQRIALRTAAVIKGLQDADAKGAGFMDRATFAKIQAEKYINDQPEWLTKAANNEAYQLTFTSDNKAAQAVQSLLNKGVLPATTYSPEFHWGRLLGGLFVKTPFNLMKQFFLNSPMALAMKESAGWTGDFESKRLAATKMAVGSSIMSGIFLAAGSHTITGDGPVDPNQTRMRKEMGIPDRAIGAFGHYMSYAGMGPLGDIIALAANAAESYHAATPENKGEYIAHVTTAFARLVDHLPLMHQVGYLEQAIQSAGRGDFKDMEGRFADALSTGIRPEILKQISESLDPTIKQSNTAIQRLAQDNPYTRANVPLLRDHWGYPQYVPPGYEHDEIPPSPLETALYLFNPFHTSMIRDPDPVDVERMRVGANDRRVPDMFIGSAGPQGITSDANSPKVGVPYHPTDVVENARLRDRLSVLAGHELTIGGVNQHDAMLAEMNKDYYKGHTEYWQAEKLDKISLQYLEHARIQLMKENPDLRERVRERQGQRREEMSGGHATIGAP